MNDDNERLYLFIGSAVFVAAIVAAHLLGAWVAG